MFHLTLTGNNTSASITNQKQGMVITFVIQQDVVGSRVWTPPIQVPMASVDPSPNVRSVQQFVVDSSGIVPISPLTAS